MQQTFENLSDDDIVGIATPIMDNLMQGSTERDWAKHTKHFTAGAKRGLTPENLLEQCETYQAKHGYFAEREFIGITRHPAYVNLLWKQTMTGTPGEFMAILTLVKQDGEFRVIRCWVDLWEPK